MRMACTYLSEETLRSTIQEVALRLHDEVDFGTSKKALDDVNELHALVTALHREFPDEDEITLPRGFPGAATGDPGDEDGA